LQGFAWNIHGGSYSLCHFTVKKINNFVSLNSLSCRFLFSSKNFASLLFGKSIFEKTDFFCCLDFSGEYRIWKDPIQLSLIWKIWQKWKNCELNETDQIYCYSNITSLIDYILFFTQDSEKLLIDWFNPRIPWKYGRPRYSVSFSNCYLHGNA
jgi:hypothetical protein